MTEIARNGLKNGVFIKFVMGIVSSLALAGIVGNVAMYRELGIVKTSMRTEAQVTEALRVIAERVARNEERLIEIDKARIERTSWGLRLEQLEHRVERMEVHR